jgi:hypothetical protein
VASAEQEEKPSGSARVASVGRLAAALLVVAGSFAGGVKTAPRFRTGPDNSLPSRIGNNVGPSRSIDAALKQLRIEGVLIRPNVRQSLDALLYWFDKRPDLRSNLGRPDGSPDLVPLLAYAATVDDATAVSLVPYRPGLSELRGRMGIIDGGGADITSALFWLFANRPDPQIDTDAVITVLAGVWKSRPEIHEQFLVQGRLQLVPYLFWAANVPSDDPSVTVLTRIQFQLEQLPAELQPT